ncbi:MAG: hypothetical protein QN141_04255 [Armatimonadota bacterium]|nr:hypothetical protein [Armatimonadota bacterium]MDR7450576.1 hypothetical protein [Armatimonadota bacterium]MDR7466291.1 hypothetical protein [Armatimonadota bacterium]MDR7493012.1 hypothetical protein [Armatimonadota bacterium]MDR7498231.1 hypothetical protein [Armatimonadota bacterium]
MERIALVLSVLALVVSVAALAGRGQGPPEAVGPRPPATLTLSMVVATFSGQGVAAHRWYPTMLVVRRGDTVDLAVGNPDRYNHDFELTGYNLRTGKLRPGSSRSLRFVADRTGVFLFRCALPHNPATGDCTPDHDLMRGYLLVTE